MPNDSNLTKGSIYQNIWSAMKKCNNDTSQVQSLRIFYHHSYKIKIFFKWEICKYDEKMIKKIYLLYLNQ